MQNNDKGSEEKKRKTTNKKVPQSIIDFYSKYRNKSLTIKPVIVMGTRFEIEERYQIIDAVGQGAYGIVVAAKDHMNADVMVAIKKIEKAFEHKIFTKRTLRELRILRLLNHENIINLKSILLPKSRETFEDIYCVSELMETDMAQIIRSPQPISDDHIQFFIYQILRGLKYLHSCRIMHRDLKPRNLLMNSNCDLKICDFGLARSMEVEEAVMDMTDYVATRWYRAPELLLAHKDYSPAIDIWSVGCILAELLKRKPFLPGIDSRNQLELIIDLLGTPPDKLIEQIPREKIRRLINSWPKKEAKTFTDLFPASNPLAVDLLEKLLQFDPSKRITVEEALNHEYLQQFHCPSDEPVGSPVDTIEFEFEMFDLNREQLKDLIYEEILLYHFEDFEKDFEAKKKKKESIIAHILKNDNALYKENENTDD